MFKIKVPATSANIGCGFDTLGMALNLYSTFSFEISDHFIVQGCPKEYQNENNLVIQSYKKVFETLKKDIIPVSVKLDSQIPISRGLGSSASCIVAGIWAANKLLNYPMNKEQCLDLATQIEGHPDNVAPAIYGNLCSSFIDDKVYTQHFPISEKLRFLVMIPDFEVSTSQARKVLPSKISYQEAIFNLSRIVCLCKALQDNDHEMIAHALKDQLHEPYRKQLIDEYDQIKEICQNEISLFISGSGPTLICIVKNDINDLTKQLKKLKNHWQCLNLQVDSNGLQEEDYD
ncbi:MAG: homoserine kinase [Traorella sp.]